MFFYYFFFPPILFVSLLDVQGCLRALYKAPLFWQPSCDEGQAFQGMPHQLDCWHLEECDSSLTGLTRPSGIRVKGTFLQFFSFLLYPKPLHKFKPLCGNHSAQQWNAAIAIAHFQSAERNHPRWNSARILSYSAVNCKKFHHDQKCPRTCFYYNSKLEFLQLIMPRTRRLKPGSSNRKYVSVSELCFLL